MVMAARAKRGGTPNTRDRTNGKRKPAALTKHSRKNSGTGQKILPPEVVQAFIAERARGRSYRGTLRVLREQFREKAPKSLSTLQRWDRDFDDEIRILKRDLREKMVLALMEGEKARLRTLGMASQRLIELIEGAEGGIEAKDVPRYARTLRDLVEQARLEEKGAVGEAVGGPDGQAGRAGPGNFLGGLLDLARAMADDPKAAENVGSLLRGVGDSIVATHPELGERAGE